MRISLLGFLAGVVSKVWSMCRSELAQDCWCLWQTAFASAMVSRLPSGSCSRLDSGPMYYLHRALRGCHLCYFSQQVALTV